MAAERDERLYLSDIVTAIDRILEYTAAGRQAFLDERLTQDAVVRNIEIIGEAVRNLSDATRQASPHVPWSKIVGTRDRSHELFDRACRRDVRTVQVLLGHANRDEGCSNKWSSRRREPETYLAQHTLCFSSICVSKTTIADA